MSMMDKTRCERPDSHEKCWRVIGRQARYEDPRSIKNKIQ